MKKDDEHQPLLGHRDGHENEEDSKTKTSWTSTWHLLPQIHVTEPRFRFLPLVGCLIILVNEGEYYFKQIGFMRALEALYCVEYYQSIDPEIAQLGRKIPENMCKLNSVQKKVATANGVIILVRMTASFLGTMPLGILADRIGRRFVGIMHKVGTMFYCVCVVVTYLGWPTIPIWVSFLGGLGGLIGANIDLNLATMLAAYTDVMTDSSQRSSYFFMTTSMQYVGQVAFPLAAGRAINLDGQGTTPEVSLFISLAMACSGLLITIFLWPETLNKGHPAVETLDDSEEETNEQRKSSKTGLFALLRSRLRSFGNDFKHNVRGIGTLNLLLLALSIFLATAAIKCVDWLGLIQYPVIKFGWKYNQSTYAMAIQAVVYIITYFVLLPWYNRIGSRSGLTTSSTSLLIMLFSLVFLEAGAVFLGFSATAGQFIAATTIYTLGTVLPTVMQAYIANLVEKTGLGKLMALLSLFQVAGKVCASGVGPIIIKAGIDSSKEELKGAIFFFSAIIFLLSASALGIVALRAGVTKKAVEELAEEAQDGNS